MKKAFVKPAPGLKVRMPGRLSELLPDAGAEVELNDYWHNRIRDADVLVVTPAAAAKPAATIKSK